MSDIAISVENVSKLYHIGRKASGSLRETISGKIDNLFRRHLNEPDQTEFWALKDVSFDIKRGDIVGIIGKNGAGKSTLLKVLSRITEPTSGKIQINGRVGSLLEVGTGFHPELSGRENIFLNGSILGMKRSEIQAKFDEIVDFSGIEKFIDTPVKRYSSGMYVRLAFAVAAHLEPEILIIDEVLAVGDAEFQKKCLGKMQDVAGHGRTVIFVSHNMTAVKSLCRNGILLKSGKTEFFGEVNSAVQLYLNLTSAKNLHSNFDLSNAPGNESAKLLEAEVVTKSDGTPFFSGDPVIFKFTILNFLKGTNHLDITFHLFDEMNNLVFVSGTARTQKSLNIPSGVINAVCEIPADLLHEGSYKVGRLLLVKDRGFVVCEFTDPLSFDVQNEGGMAGWMGQKEGIVKPRVNWNLSYSEGTI